MNKHTDFIHAVVITGGIATGKSTVLRYFFSQGFSMIDADEIAHGILQDQAPAISRCFGESFIEKGEVNRQKLGAFIFQDPVAKKTLETMLHPLIDQKIMEDCRRLEQEKKTYFVDIPLFFELNHYQFDRVIVVYTEEHIQHQRLIARNGLSSEQAMLRIQSQISIAEKKLRAWTVIDNCGDKIQLFENCQRCLRWIEDQSIG